MFAQSMRTKLGFLFPASGEQPFAFAMILYECDPDQHPVPVSWVKNLRCNTIRSRRILPIANDDASAERIDIQRVIDHVHMISSRKWASDTIDFAGEAAIGDAEWGFPYLLNISCQSFRIRRDAGRGRKTDHVEFRKDEVCLGRIRPIVEEDNETFAAVDHVS